MRMTPRVRSAVKRFHKDTTATPITTTSTSIGTSTSTSTGSSTSPSICTSLSRPFDPCSPSPSFSSPIPMFSFSLLSSPCLFESSLSSSLSSLVSSIPINAATVGTAVAVLTSIGGGINWFITRAERQRRTYIRNIVEGLSRPFHASAPRYGPFFPRMLLTPRLGHHNWQSFMLHLLNGDIYHAFHGATGSGDKLALLTSLHGRTDVVRISLDEARDDATVIARFADAIRYHGGKKDVTYRMDDLLEAFRIACRQRCDTLIREEGHGIAYRKVIVIVEEISACVSGGAASTELVASLNMAASQLAGGLLRLYDEGLINVIYDVPYHGVELLRSARHVSGHSRLTSSPYPAIDGNYLRQQLRLLIVQKQSQQQADITKIKPTEQQQVQSAEKSDEPERTETSLSHETDTHTTPTWSCSHRIRHSVPIRRWEFLSAPLHPIPHGYHLVFSDYEDVDMILSRVGTHMGHIASILYGVVEDKRKPAEVVSEIIAGATGLLYSALLGSAACVSSLDRATFILVTYRLMEQLCQNTTDEPLQVRWDHVECEITWDDQKQIETEQQQDARTPVTVAIPKNRSKDVVECDEKWEIDGMQLHATVDRLVQLELLRFTSPMTVALHGARLKWAYRETVRNDPAVKREYQWAVKTLMKKQQSHEK